MEWLPFYPGITSTSKRSHGHTSKQEGPPNAEAIPQVLDVCSYWIQSFIKYSKWLENPSNVKAARFLSRGYIKHMIRELSKTKSGMSYIYLTTVFCLCTVRHNKVVECMEEIKIRK